MRFLILVILGFMLAPLAFAYNPCSRQERDRLQRESQEVAQYFKSLPPHSETRDLYFIEHHCFMASQKEDGSQGAVKVSIWELEKWETDPTYGKCVRVVLPERGVLQCSRQEGTVMGEEMSPVVELSVIAPNPDRLDLFVKISDVQPYGTWGPIGPEVQKVIRNVNLHQGVVIPVPSPVDDSGAEAIRIWCTR